MLKTLYDSAEAAASKVTEALAAYHATPSTAAATALATAHTAADSAMAAVLAAMTEGELYANEAVPPTLKLVKRNGAEIVQVVPTVMGA